MLGSFLVVFWRNQKIANLTGFLLESTRDHGAKCLKVQQRKNSPCLLWYSSRLLSFIKDKLSTQDLHDVSSRFSACNMPSYQKKHCYTDQAVWHDYRYIHRCCSKWLVVLMLQSYAKLVSRHILKWSFVRNKWIAIRNGSTGQAPASTTNYQPVWLQTFAERDSSEVFVTAVPKGLGKQCSIIKNKDLPRNS